MASARRILVTGGAGYVGSQLVPTLTAAGHDVVVLDLYWFGRDVLKGATGPGKLTEIVGDIRDVETVKKAVAGCDTVIHLACISNDPSYDLDPELGKSINHDAFRPLVKASKDAGVKRFIYASSSSVYGIKNEPEVTENLPLEPLTDYSKFKAICEDILHEEAEKGFSTLIIRPATVCGYAPRLRLDLTVNILTNHAINNGRITVFGGSQKRPNIHINDMVGAYCHVLGLPDEKTNGGVYNVGYENFTVSRIAEMVQGVVGRHVDIETKKTDDLRSYHVSSGKIKKELGFEPQFTIENAITDLKDAFERSLVSRPMENDLYFNIKRMTSLAQG